MDHSEVKHFPKVDHTPAQFDSESTALLKAADWIEAYGWWSGKMGAATSKSACAVLAIHNVSEGATFRGAIKRLAIDLGVSPAVWEIYHWNDAQKSGDAVIAKLRAVALTVR